MKKILAILVVVFVLVSQLGVFAADTEIIIDGETATISEGMGKIVMQDERTFVPVRFLLEHLDFIVQWSDEDQTVFGQHASGETFIMQIGNKSLFYFDEEGTYEAIEMDVEPFLNLTEKRTYVPLRFIAEAMGYKVGWDEKTSTVTLTK